MNCLFALSEPGFDSRFLSSDCGFFRLLVCLIILFLLPMLCWAMETEVKRLLVWGFGSTWPGVVFCVVAAVALGTKAVEGLSCCSRAPGEQGTREDTQETQWSLSHSVHLCLRPVVFPSGLPALLSPYPCKSGRSGGAGGRKCPSPPLWNKSLGVFLLRSWHLLRRTLWCVLQG